MCLYQTIPKHQRCARRLRRWPSDRHKARVIPEYPWLHSLHLAAGLELAGVVVRQKTQKLTGQNKRGDGLLIKPCGSAGQAHLVAEFHVGGVVTQTCKAVMTQI